MSSDSSRSWTASPNWRWSSSTRSSRSRSRPARSSMNGRHRSTSFLRGRRRRLAGQPLAHHHGDGLLDRRVGAVGDLVELAAMEAVVEHGGEIAAPRRACGASRSPRRAPARPPRTPRAPAGRRAPAGDAPPDRGRRASARSNRRGRARSRPRARVSLRGGSGSRALPPTRPGRSAAKRNLELGLRAIARRQPVTARLNGSVGDSFAVRFRLDVGGHVSAGSRCARRIR